MRIRQSYCVGLAWVLLGVIGCKPHPKQGAQHAPNDVVREPHVREDMLAPVVFDITPITTFRSSEGWHSYECVYRAGGKAAKFRLEWKQKGAMTTDDAFPVAAAEGRFVAVTSSDNTVLLGDLKKALDAKSTFVPQVRIAELEFDAVLMGQHQSRNSSDEFFEHPSGNWMLLKLFLPKGGDDGEVFLNLDPASGKGEFSIKDSDYGDYLLKELAQVL